MKIFMFFLKIFRKEIMLFVSFGPCSNTKSSFTINYGDLKIVFAIKITVLTEEGV